MTNPALVSAHIQDTTDLYSDIQNSTLPAISFVKPSALVGGHPASSKLDLFEGLPDVTGTQNEVSRIRVSKS